MTEIPANPEIGIVKLTKQVQKLLLIIIAYHRRRRDFCTPVGERVRFGKPRIVVAYCARYAYQRALLFALRYQHLRLGVFHGVVQRWRFSPDFLFADVPLPNRCGACFAPLVWGGRYLVCPRRCGSVDYRVIFGFACLAKSSV